MAEYFGAAEIVLIHRRELRDALIREQSKNRARPRAASANLMRRVTGMVGRIADSVLSTPLASARATATLLAHRSQPAPNPGSRALVQYDVSQETE